MSKYVVMMEDGKLQAPVPLSNWIAANDTETLAEAACYWLRGVAFVTGGGAAPQQCSMLVDLPL